MSRARTVRRAGQRAVGALAVVTACGLAIGTAPAWAAPDVEPVVGADVRAASGDGVADVRADSSGESTLDVRAEASGESTLDVRAEASGESTSNVRADSAVTPTPIDDLVRGLIVKTTSGSVSARALAAASQDALAEADEPTDVVVGSAVAPRTRVLTFDQPVTAADAEAAALELQARPDVEWAVPDRLMRIAASPVLPNDPLFPEQWDVWDSAAVNGGYSVKAPLLWPTTAGSSSVVVAVIDTGVTAHPDLDASIVPGYDFIHDVDVANDGNARDPDPADPGDWITGGEAAYGPFEGCEVTNSSWHGTHVAGTIAAVRDNGIGIAGIAPGVRLQPLRALGKCGGYTSDVLAAMRWAAGGDVPGVPANPTPAKVINLSLGSIDPCSAADQETIDFVRARGVTVVVATGNEDSPVSTSSPANCRGVIAVSATARNGSRASYSNYGESVGQVTLSAPGGDASRDSRILSTYNSGTRSPAAPTYSNLQGTSMATPHVSAAAALAYSLGATTADEVKNLLTAAVQPFPTGVGDACTVVRCGAGILDLSRLVVAGPPDAPVNVTALAGDESASISWAEPERNGGAPITSYVATAQPGGSMCTTATTSCVISGLANGTTYSVSVTATNAAGLTSSASLAVSVTPQFPAVVPGAVTDITVKWRGFGRSLVAVLRWSPPVIGDATEYRARIARVGGSYGSWSYVTAPVIRATDLRPGRAYRVQIQAGNDAGWGPASVIRLQP